MVPSERTNPRPMTDPWREPYRRNRSPSAFIETFPLIEQQTCDCNYAIYASNEEKPNLPLASRPRGMMGSCGEMLGKHFEHTAGISNKNTCLLMIKGMKFTALVEGRPDTGSNERTLFMFESFGISSSSSFTGILLETRPVFPPCGTTPARFSQHNFIILLTSEVVHGFRTVVDAPWYLFIQSVL
jgi:hypothetical protein